MKRIMTLLCALCLLLSLTGCNALRQRNSGAVTDIAYPFTWQEQRDGTFLLSFEQPTPEGYVWEVTSPGLVRVLGTSVTKSGTDAIRLEAVANGEQVTEMRLIATDTQAHLLYTLQIGISVDKNAYLSITSCEGFAGNAVATAGDVAYPISYVLTESGLELSMSDVDWQVSHENNDFVIDEEKKDGILTLTIHRMDESRFYDSLYGDLFFGTEEQAEPAEEEPVEETAPITYYTYNIETGYFQRTATYTDTTTLYTYDPTTGCFTEVENPLLTVQQKQDDTFANGREEALEAFYAEKTDVLTLGSYLTNITYTIRLTMGSDGMLTIDRVEQSAYTADAPAYAGMQLYYDEATGETRVHYDDNYVSRAAENYAVQRMNDEEYTAYLAQIPEGEISYSQMLAGYTAPEKEETRYKRYEQVIVTGTDAVTGEETSTIEFREVG